MIKQHSISLHNGTVEPSTLSSEAGLEKEAHIGPNSYHKAFIDDTFTRFTYYRTLVELS